MTDYTALAERLRKCLENDPYQRDYAHVPFADLREAARAVRAWEKLQNLAPKESRWSLTIGANFVDLTSYGSQFSPHPHHDAPIEAIEKVGTA